MVTKNKRLAISLPLDVKDVYERAGKAMGVPASTYIASILIEGSGAVEELVKILEKKSPHVETMVNLASMTRNVSDEVQSDLIDEIASKKGSK